MADTCSDCTHWEDGDLFFNCKSRIGAKADTTCVQFRRDWLRVFRDELAEAEAKKAARV